MVCRRGDLAMSQKRGQVWVETVIYTLIGIAIIGIVLGISLPNIEAKQDEIVIEQSIEAMNLIDEKITAVFSSGAGNRRVIELTIGQGEFIVDQENDLIRWTVPSSFAFSEEGITIPVGDIDVTTNVGGDDFLVTLEIDYAVDLAYEGVSEPSKTLFAAPTPYSLVIENQGTDSFGNVIVSFSEA